MKVVARQQEHTVFAPLEALALAARTPDRRRAAPLCDVDHLVERQPDRWEDTPWRDLADPRLGDALLTFELNESRVAAALFPAAEPQLAQVLDVVAAVDRQAERVHPVIVGELQPPRRGGQYGCAVGGCGCRAVRASSSRAPCCRRPRVVILSLRRIRHFGRTTRTRILRSSALREASLRAECMGSSSG